MVYYMITPICYLKKEITTTNLSFVMMAMV